MGKKKGNKKGGAGYDDDIWADDVMDSAPATEQQQPPATADTAVTEDAGADTAAGAGGGGLMGMISKAKKNKKSKNEGGASTPQQQPGESGAGLGSEEPTEVVIKTAKQKEREKKEKAKLLKKQKADSAKAKREEEMRELEESMGSASVADSQKQEDTEEQASGGGKKKKKKGKKAEDQEPEEPTPAPAAAPVAAAEEESKKKKKGKKGGQIAALQKMVEEQRRREEEARIAAEEERKRIEEEERLAAEEEARLEAKREAKREADRLRKEQLRKEGKLLTKKQKEAKARQEKQLKAMLDAGVQVAGLASDGQKTTPARKDVFQRDAEERKQRAAERKRREEEAEKKRLGEMEAARKKKEEEEKAAKEAEADDGDVADDWEALLSDNEDEKEEDETPVESAKKEEPENEDNDGEEEEESESEESEESGDSSEDEEEEEHISSARRQAQVRKDAAVARREQRVKDAMAARSADNLRSPICCILGHVDTGKCWGRDTPIMMLDGTTRMVQDIKENDLVMGDDNTGRTVQPGSVIKGEGMLYRVIPDEGSGADSFVCNGDHILVFTYTPQIYVDEIPGSNGRYVAKSLSIDSTTNRPQLEMCGEFESKKLALTSLSGWKPLTWKCSVLEYLELVQNESKMAEWLYMYKPVDGIEFPESAGKRFTDAITQTFGFAPTLLQELETAKLLGLWLSSQTSASKEVVEFMQQWAHMMQTTCNPVSESFPGTEDNQVMGYTFGQSMQDLLVELGMTRAVDSKQRRQIDDPLMSTSMNHRQALLAGIIDGAGARRSDVALHQQQWVITKLDADVLAQARRLARSIGLRAVGYFIDQKDKRLVISGELMHSLNSHILSASNRVVGDNRPNRQELYRDNSWRFAIEEIGRGEYFGFTLDGNSRVLLGDYTVSHNTKLLDKIRQTNVQGGEAGGITQQIGATYFPSEAIQQKTACLNASGKIEIKVPGLLIIDTPGHESFTNLRSRGSSLCNIAILVVDIMHGLEPQTLESLRLLKDRKTPFIVALNKVDRLYGWKATPNGPFRKSLKAQPSHTQAEFKDRVAKTIVAFAEQGLNAKLYYENKNFSKYVSLVPTSAVTGEGIPDLLALLVGLTQSRMTEKLMYLSELECTVLEVKVIEGLGTTIDVVLSNGVLHEGDRIVVMGLEGPIVTNVRALLTPQPMRELRVKSSYVHHKSIKAAMGVKITAPDLDKAIAGSRLLVVGPDDDEEELMEEVMSDLSRLDDYIDKSGRGVHVQASTLGSLEALLEFLRTSKIPVFSINIGPVHKKDVTRASTMLEKAKEYAVMLCFDVKVEREAEDMAKELGIRVFRAEIIYHLFDDFTKYSAEVMELKRKEQAPQAVFPCVLKMIQGAIFNKRDPIVMGVDVMEGHLRIGTPICVVKTDALTQEEVVTVLGKVTSMEVNHKPVESVKKGKAGAGVAISVECPPGEAPKMFGRHFDEEDMLYSRVTRKSIDVLKETFRGDLTMEEWRLVAKLKKVLSVQ